MTQPTILIVRSEADRTDAHEFEDDVARRLAALGGDVVVVPSLVSMHDDHPALAQVRELTGRVLCASWLYARACEWLLRYRGVDADTSCVRLDDYQTPHAAVEALRDLAGLSDDADSSGSVQELATDEPPQRWYPVLDYETCIDCKQCYDFCLFGVYSVDESDRVVVTQPDLCKPGCVACARLCPSFAIMFPLHEAHTWVAGGPGEPPLGPPDLTEFFGEAADEVAARIAEAGTYPRDASTHDDLDDLIDALDELDV